MTGNIAEEIFQIIENDYTRVTIGATNVSGEKSIAPIAVLVLDKMYKTGD